MQTKQMLKELMKSKENANEVQSNFVNLINICDAAKGNHESLKLPLPVNANAKSLVSTKNGNF